MKTKMGLLISTCALAFAQTSFAAATTFTFTGPINSLYQGTSGTAATGSLVSHYAAGGISVGHEVQFDVTVDFSRQGQMTNEDGSVTVFTDVPVTRNCDTCYGYRGVSYDFAELTYSSVNFSPSSYYPGQKSYNVATSRVDNGMATNSDTSYVELGDYLVIREEHDFSGSAMVYGWKANERYSSDFVFSFYYDDGAGLVQANGNLELVSAVPIPATVWLLGSGLVGLAGISRRKK